MQGTILLNYDEDIHQVEEEEKNRFLRSILEQIELPIQDIWGEELILSVEQKIQLRQILSSYDIKIIDDFDGNMKVYAETQVIGEWHKPTYKLKKDPSQIERKKSIFLEMTLDFWSVFDDPN